MYCIDVAASFLGACNINNCKAGGGGWEGSYSCVIILGSNLSGRNDPTIDQNNYFSRMGIELTISCQYAKFDLNAAGETLLERTVYTMLFLAVIRRSCMRSAVVLTMRWVAKL